MASNGAAIAIEAGSQRAQTSTGRVSLPLSPHQTAPYTGPSRDEVLALRRQYLTPGLITYYKNPLLVVEGQESGEFGPVDPVDFAVLMSALLDGLAVQIALADPAVGANRAFELSMGFAAGQLGFRSTREQDHRQARRETDAMTDSHAVPKWSSR